VSFHPRHIAERYGLFTIIVLGESVLAVALGPAGTDWRPSAVLTAEIRLRGGGLRVVAVLRARGVRGDRAGAPPLLLLGVRAPGRLRGIAAFGVGTQLAIEAAAAPELALAAALLVVPAIIGSPLPPPLCVALVAVVVLALTVVESLHGGASSRVSA
jgi:hypothetical protein